MAKPSIFEIHPGQPLVVHRLGRTPYRQCWETQREFFSRRLAGEIPDTLLLTEHDHVYTLGRGSRAEHLLADAEWLGARGVDVVHVDRGGDITYHGPGQLVAYPILDLSRHGRDLNRYLRRLEEVVIRVLGRLGVRASCLPGYTGVWVAGDKICAIGIKASRWVTMHGIALNVTTDLSYFRRIIPCGIFEKGVTSVLDATGLAYPLAAIEDHFIDEVAAAFGSDAVPESLQEER
ncbi:MAG: lipoyl(octanoyl) transferase LipB [Bacteroidetes bacterium]|nr:lipoyl(octanoyl) transferase LipB [Bacteroidota bacterium]